MPKEWAMQTLIPLLWVAGGIHLGIGVANFALPRRLRYRENLSKVSPIIRQIFVVHSLYIVVVVLLFAALCLFFASDLAGASRLGRFLSAAMAVFWLLLIPLQLFYYDGGLRRPNRFLGVAYTAVGCFLAGIFSLAAVGFLR